MLPAALFLAGNSQLQLCCAPLSLIKGVPSLRAHRDKCLRDALGAFAALPQQLYGYWLQLQRSQRKPELK